MSFTVPNTWKFHSSSGNGNSITFTLPGHTVQTPAYAMINRIAPVFDNKRRTWSVPSYRVRTYFGVLDAEGTPDPTKTQTDLTCRCSVASDGKSKGALAVNALLAVVNQPDFVDAAYGGQNFPTIAP